MKNHSTHLLKAERISFSYSQDERVILDEVELKISEGEVLSILGPNGSGKSTLLNCIAGLITSSSGSISLNGIELKAMKYRDIAKIIAYVPQTVVATFAYSVLDYVTMGRAPSVGVFRRPSTKDLSIAYDAIAQMGIEYLKDKAYTEISGGERQLATIARAIAQQPKLILFDEPTANLDFGNQYKVLELVKKLSEQDYAILMTTHNPDHVLLLGGNVALLNKAGKLYSGKVEDMIDESSLHELYGIDIRIVFQEELQRRACLTPNL